MDAVALFVRDELAGHCTKNTSVVTSASDYEELESKSIVELLHAAEEGSTVSTASPDILGTSCPWNLVTDIHWLAKKQE